MALLFLAAVSSPLWYNTLTGRAGYAPDLKLPEKERQCVEERLYMRQHHADLLDLWKQRVVRDGERQYRSAEGKTYEMSLTGTCMKCHTVKADFCDRCHAYAGTSSPPCWDCHQDPGRMAGKSE